MNSTTQTPREIDEQLAELTYKLYAVEDRIANVQSHLLRLAGAEFYYAGRRRVTDMSIDQALEILHAHVAMFEAYQAEHNYTETHSWGEYVGTNWDHWTGRLAPHEAETPGKTIAQLDELEAQRTELENEVGNLQMLYTGWSRFFLVTSSSGHIHSSMHCSTCRPTTRYGWLPALSGKTEAEAVKDCGPTLCSVCFPSAPTEWTTGKKITAAQAARKAAA
jgi:hypothetical protein